ISDASNNACNGQIIVTPPLPCSFESCNLNDVEILNIICIDPNTPEDPNDDEYTFEIIVDGANLGTGWSANDPNSASGNYGIPTLFGPFLINGGPLNITLVDNEDPDCTVGFLVNPPEPCSEAFCEIEDLIIENIVCDDGGTPTNRNDDTFTFTLEAIGNNTSNGWQSSLGPNGMYNEQISFGPFSINDGIVALTVTDLDDPDCSRSILVTPPPHCSDQVCQINDINV
ncbi:MAG: hypothetical protein AAGK97_19075, partial [Bacteroidota bacterium]